jgi:hypothetical protein
MRQPYDSGPDVFDEQDDRASVIPPAGLPLDIVRDLSLCAPEQRAEVARLLERCRAGARPHALFSYSVADIERVRALVRSFRRGAAR